MKYLVFLVLLCGMCFGQTAKVIALSPEDAAQSQKLHEAAIAAQKAVEEFDHDIDKKYLPHVPDSGSSVTCPSDWNCTPKATSLIYPWTGGFEYSDDWRFIVPKPPTANSVTIGNVWPATCPSLYVPNSYFTTLSPATCGGTGCAGAALSTITAAIN